MRGFGMNCGAVRSCSKRIFPGRAVPGWHGIVPNSRFAAADLKNWPYFVPNLRFAAAMSSLPLLLSRELDFTLSFGARTSSGWQFPAAPPAAPPADSTE